MNNRRGQTRFVNRMRLVPDDDDTYNDTDGKPRQYLGDIKQLRELFQPSTQQAYKRAKKQYTQVMQQPDRPNLAPYLRQKEILDALQNFRHMQNIYKQQAQQAIATTSPTNKLLTRLIDVMEKKPSFSSSKQQQQKKPHLKLTKRRAPFRSGPIPYKRQRMIEQHPEEQFDDRSADAVADDEFVLADEDREEEEEEEDQQQEEEEDAEHMMMEPSPSPAKAKKRTPAAAQKESARRKATASVKRVAADIPSGTADIKSRLRNATQRAAGLWYRSVIEKPIAWVNIRHIGD